MNPLLLLTISGLRGFSTKQSLKLAVPNGQEGSGITYLTGPNNSGKSTIIEAFRAYIWRHNRPSYHEGMRNRALNFVRVEFYYAHGVDWIESLREGGSETQSNITPGERFPYVIPSRRHFAPYFHRQPQIYDRHNYLLTSGDANYHQLRGPSLNQFEMRLFDIDRDENKRKAFNEIIARIVPQGVNWSIDQTENSQWVLRFLGEKKAHSAEGVGEGIASLFTLVAAFYDSNPGDLIIIDEPELSLHPAYQKRLSALIREFAAERQIIISTHSPYLIDGIAIRNGAEICRTWDREDGTEIHQIDSNARIALGKLTNLNINNPHQFGLDAKEVFFLEDGVIVVEGQEDVVLMPRVFEEVGIIPGAELFGWGAGGASNITHILAILKALGFRRVAGVFDADKIIEMNAAKDEFPEYWVGVIPFDDIRTKESRTIQRKEGMLTTKGMLLSQNRDAAIEFSQNISNYFK